MNRMPSPSVLDANHERRPVPATGTAQRIDWPAWLLPAFALACWALTIRHLAGEWSTNEQYHFGWLVPLLAAYLVKVRAERLPQPSPPSTHWPTAVLSLTLAVASILVMPIREANLDWRLVDWTLASIAIAASLVCFWQLGGLPWVRHFAFPLLFFLIAVPLPRNLEYPWMDRLMWSNAHLSVECLHWLGVEAEARGNLIQLSTGTLGVEEACSGIRSLQSTLMLSLFLGEILALSWVRRVVLLGAGLGWALVTNVGRTTILGWIAAHHGLAAVDRWHTTAGFSVLAISSLTVAATAWLLRYRSAKGDAERSVAFDPAEFVPRWRPAAAFAAVGIGVLVAGWAATEWWFDRQSQRFSDVTEWNFHPPDGPNGAHELPIAEQTRRILNFTEGFNARWNDPAGLQWQAYFFRWEGGRNATQAARPHDPRNCLGAAGMKLIEVLPDVRFARRDVELTFDAFHFEDRGRGLYVFNCLVEDVRSAAGLRAVRYRNSPGERLRAALAGQRQAGQRRLEVALWNAPDAATASARFRELIEQQIRVAAH